ncbi:hypothetical protein Lste_1081 [Legionella steelei]|uniref:Uncharacterized protein n=1 Tax=Legionella steelei TaxID=947033 RepID=A0A0W0ZGL8_9GAMM|nr:hypothetical protein Lste_1081 [Legionella steelei]
MAERSNAAVLKTVEGQPSQGSNPCLSAKFLTVINQQLLIKYCSKKLTFEENIHSLQLQQKTQCAHMYREDGSYAIEII